MELTTTIRCPAGHSVEVPVGTLGRETACPDCGVRFQVAAGPPGVRQRFGEIATEMGLVAPRQLQRALQRQADLKVQGHKLIGELLIELGLLTAEHVQSILDKQGRAVPFATPGRKTPSATPTRGTVAATPGRSTATTTPQIPGYSTERKIGSGGMGDVFLARQLSLDRPVALKILASDLAGDREFVQRFLAEARAAGRLDHENIVRAVDVGEFQGTYYFAMEYVEGETLDRVLNREGPFPERRALGVCRQIAAGLKHAHANGFIHRDIKPSNLIVTPKGVVKILDFGLVRELHTDVRITQAGGVHSSPLYASPEQSRGDKCLDHRGDMYSLGVSLFELLTGRPPFVSDTPSALFVKHATEAPPSPRALRQDLSEATSQFVLRLLRKKPEARFTTYDELVRAADAAENDHRPVTRAAPKTPPAAAARQFPAVLVAIAAVVVVLVLAGIVIVSRPGPGSSKADPAGGAADSDAGRYGSEAKALARERRPSEIPSARQRLKELESKHRATQQHGVFASALVEFESGVAADADAAAKEVLLVADVEAAAGNLTAAVFALQRFAAVGYAGTDAAARVSREQAHIEKTINDRFQEMTAAAMLVAAERKFVEARTRVEEARWLVMSGDRYLRPSYEESLRSVAQKIDELDLLARSEKPDPKKPPARQEAPKDNTKFLRAIAVLKDSALRPERAAAVDAFIAQPGCGLYRAAAYYLWLEERGWGLIYDRLTVQTENGELCYEGAKLSGNADSLEFLDHDGMRIRIAGSALSINGGGPVKAITKRIEEGLQSPFMAPLQKYLAGIPWDRAPRLTSDEHRQQLVILAAIGVPSKAHGGRAIQMFAAAHVDDILRTSAVPPYDSVKSLELVKVGHAWGPMPQARRVDLAVRLTLPPDVALVAAARDAIAQGDPETRLLGELAAFMETDVEVASALDRWQRLASQLRQLGARRFAESVAKKFRESKCSSCVGAGQVECSTCHGYAVTQEKCPSCQGKGYIDKGSGLVDDCSMCVKGMRETKCKTCSGKGTAVCSTCRGAKLAKSLPGPSLRAFLATGKCMTCSGSGAIFERAGFPCPSCDGLGRAYERQTRAIVPADYASLIAAAWARYRDVDFDGMLLAGQKAMEAPSANRWEACMVLSAAWLHKGNAKESVKWGTEALRLAPDNPSVLMNTTEAMICAGQYLEAGNQAVAKWSILKTNRDKAITTYLILVGQIAHGRVAMKTHIPGNLKLFADHVDLWLKDGGELGWEFQATERLIATWSDTESRRIVTDMHLLLQGKLTSKAFRERHVR